MQSSCPVVPPKTKTKPSKCKAGTGARAPSLPNTREFSACRNDPPEGRHLSPRFPNRLREPEAPPRPSAGESPRQAAAARSPPPRKSDSTTLCASGWRPRPLLLLLPAAGRPLCWRGAPGAEDGGWGAGPAGGALLPAWNAPAPAPQVRLPAGEAAQQVPAACRSRSSASAPRLSRPATLFEEGSPSRLRVRPRPGPGGHRGLDSGNVAPRVT